MGIDRNPTKARSGGAIVPKAAPAWPPTCRVCGWQGEPNGDQSPYRACGGVPARHQRTPVLNPTTPPPALTPPAQPRTRPTQGLRRTLGPQAPCGTCGRRVRTVGSPDGPLILTHGPFGDRCPGSEHPPATEETP